MRDYSADMPDMNEMQTIFVTGTDTGVGKTYISCLLIRKLRQSGLKVGAYKPACSGAEYDSSGSPFWTDVESLHAATGLGVPIDLVCPQRFLAPVAPNVAARLEQTTVSNELLLSGVSEWKHKTDVLVIEGAGGVFCPLSDELTVLDFAIQMQVPVLVVAANRLGVISHTRLTVDRLQHSGLHVAGVILNEVQVASGDASLQSNAQQISHWLPDVALLHAGFRSDSIFMMHNDAALTNSLLARIIDRF